MMTCELEPVLSQLERETAAIASEPTARRLPACSNAADWFYSATAYAESKSLSKDLFSKRKEYPHVQDSFVELMPGFDPTNRWSVLPLHDLRLGF